MEVPPYLNAIMVRAARKFKKKFCIECRRRETSPESMAPWAKRGGAAADARIAALSRLPRLCRLVPCGRSADPTASRSPLFSKSLSVDKWLQTPTASATITQRAVPVRPCSKARSVSGAGSTAGGFRAWLKSRGLRSCQSSVQCYPSVRDGAAIFGLGPVAHRERHWGLQAFKFGPG